jgi:hypothetical protein
MRYKTIVLALLEENPALQRRLKRERTMLRAVETYAQTLKETHEEATERLTQIRPSGDPSQISSEALEVALAELREVLPSASNPRDSAEERSLDEAMKFIRAHTPPA